MSLVVCLHMTLIVFLLYITDSGNCLESKRVDLSLDLTLKENAVRVGDCGVIGRVSLHQACEGDHVTVVSCCATSSERNFRKNCTGEKCS